MPKCPNCLKEITSIMEVVRGVTTTECELEGNQLVHTGDTEVETVDIMSYTCPKCGSIIATKLEDIERFLKEVKVNG